MKKYNFYSGPAILPESVLEQTRNAITDFAGTGLSILEISHRSNEFVKVMDEARALAKALMGLGDEHELLFLHGGALSQFHMVPMNLLPTDGTASYFDTGTWASGAIKEAKLFGNVHTACTSADKHYTYIPKTYTVAEGSAYLHITTNNTIYGTQISSKYIDEILENNEHVVADMSSDILSRQLPYSRFDLIYASAQKNIGPAGTTLVAVKKKLLGHTGRSIPKMLDYLKHIEKESMLNTPSVLAVFVSKLVLEWIQQNGLEQIELINRQKAALLYKALDESSVFTCEVDKESRSFMNVCFKLQQPDAVIEKKFVEHCTQNNIVGIKGHRSVGGFRASIYNAMPLSGVEALVTAINEFEKTV